MSNKIPDDMMTVLRSIAEEKPLNPKKDIETSTPEYSLGCYDGRILLARDILKSLGN